jgi:hypothetical protein
MDTALAIELCALASLATLALGYALGQAEFRERLRRCERERDACRARVRELERQAAPDLPGGVGAGKSPWAEGPHLPLVR